MLGSKPGQRVCPEASALKLLPGCCWPAVSAARAGPHVRVPGELGQRHEPQEQGVLFLAAACPEPALPLPQGCVGWGAATSGPRSRVGSDPAKQERGITPKLFQDLGE